MPREKHRGFLHFRLRRVHESGLASSRGTKRPEFLRFSEDFKPARAVKQSSAGLAFLYWFLAAGPRSARQRLTVGRKGARNRGGHELRGRRRERPSEMTVSGVVEDAGARARPDARHHAGERGAEAAPGSDANLLDRISAKDSRNPRALVQGQRRMALSRVSSV